VAAIDTYLALGLYVHFLRFIHVLQRTKLARHMTATLTYTLFLAAIFVSRKALSIKSSRA
jgi:hypothetical protein